MPAGKPRVDQQMTESPRLRLFWKTAVYYGICVASIIYLALAQADWMRFLPFGGLDVLHDSRVPVDGGESLSDLLTTAQPVAVLDDSLNLVTALIGCIIVMLPIRWIYMSGGLEKPRSAEVATSLLVLPLIVTGIVYIVKFSLPLAFALAGIFAGVRYRTSLKSQSDAFFTFACIAVGLSAGVRALGIGLFVAIAFSFTVLAAPPRASAADVE